MDKRQRTAHRSARLGRRRFSSPPAYTGWRRTLFSCDLVRSQVDHRPSFFSLDSWGCWDNVQDKHWRTGGPWLWTGIGWWRFSSPAAHKGLRRTMFIVILYGVERIADRLLFPLQEETGVYTWARRKHLLLPLKGFISQKGFCPGLGSFRNVSYDQAVM